LFWSNPDKQIKPDHVVSVSSFMKDADGVKMTLR